MRLTSRVLLALALVASPLCAPGLRSQEPRRPRPPLRPPHEPMFVPPPPLRGPEPREPMAQRARPEPGGPFEGLDLTREQREQIHAIAIRFEPALRDVRRALHDHVEDVRTAEAMHDRMAAAAAREGVRAAQQRLARLAQNRLDAMLVVLTPAQRAQVDARLAHPGAHHLPASRVPTPRIPASPQPSRP